ncbi:MAG: asparagine synthase (glutamine-hydrolyzing) [Candidatus Omnitrophica bacterium]|nr:asparagine synthase (glutamine-hydrolyzing) [Candidatus Omnitrophota bacterium]
MCAIFGLKSDLPHINKRQLIESITSALYHRGPDSKGFYIQNSLVLGQLRLRIIDLTEKADQPFVNENKKIFLIANGEIYNFKELRLELESSGHIFISKSDNEVILHSYEEWDRGCLEKLRGMFSFCIWDEDKGELFLARDRFGIKPLYYYFKNGIFIFASEVRAILATGLVKKRLNFKGLRDYLRYGGQKEPRTIFEDIYSLLPGHFMLLKENELKVYPYYNLLDRILIPLDLKEKELLERLNLLLKETVRLHLISDVPTAIFLSGGIDSSSLVSLVSEVFCPVKTISLIFKEREFDEQNYSDLVAKRFNTEHYKFYFDEEDIIKQLDLCIEAMDEPTFDGVNTYFISKIAKELNFKVCLSGLGGDEIFCGYNTFKRISKILLFNRFLSMIPRYARRITAAYLAKISHDNTYSHKIIDFIKYNRIHPYFWMRQLFNEDQIKKILKSPYLYETDQEELAIDKLRELETVNQLSYLEITNYMVDILLRDTDFMSMAHSLEVRIPYLDHNLAEFVLRIPSRFKIDKKVLKRILIKSLNRPLPKEIYLRPKRGFVLPFSIWMKNKLRDRIEEAFFSNDSFLDNLLDPLELKAIWKGFLSDKILWQRVWALYVLKRWLNKYL